MAPCTGCRNARPKKGELKPRCIVGPRSGRCSECIRKGRKCDVTLSRPEWKRLRDSREDFKKKLERAEEKEAELLQQLLTHKARTIRLRKQLRLAKSRTDNAIAQELDNLEIVEELEEELVPNKGTRVVARE